MRRKGIQDDYEKYQYRKGLEKNELVFINPYQRGNCKPLQYVSKMDKQQIQLLSLKLNFQLDLVLEVSEVKFMELQLFYYMKDLILVDFPF